MAIFSDSESKQDIFDLIERFDRSNLFELEISIPPDPPPVPQPHFTKIKMMKLSQDNPEGPATRVTIEDSGIEEKFELRKDKKTIAAPLVGTYYSSPSPDEEPYVKVGDKITKGTVVCIIEAMKIMNEIESEADGEIAEILVENNSSVEYGQPLFRLK